MFSADSHRTRSWLLGVLMVPAPLSSAIYVSNRNTSVGVFGTPEAVAGLLPAGTAGLTKPYVTPSGSALYYVVTVALQEDIVVAQKAGSGGFGSPRTLSEISSPSHEEFPVVSVDERVIYFGSARTDGGAKGGRDTWMSRRVNTTDPFGPPRNVAEINTDQWERPTWISGDGCRLYFYRGTSDGTNDNDIYVAKKR